MLEHLQRRMGWQRTSGSRADLVSAVIGWDDSSHLRSAEWLVASAPDWPFEPLYRPGRRLLGRAATGRTVELGAGTGKNFPHYGPAARVMALDIAWAMLARARRRRRPPVRALLVADAAHLPIRDACVETVVATFVCCVQADPRPALGEIARVLRPGGQALFLEYVLPPRGWQRRLMRLLEPPLRILYGVRWRHDLPVLLAAAGLPVARVQPVWAPVIQVIAASRELRR